MSTVARMAWGMCCASIAMVQKFGLATTYAITGVAADGKGPRRHGQRALRQVNQRV